ncbi:MAG: hypothetical protein Q4D41_00455, partial [Prevotellaceae bacterium]|nr:hypothetical protein [Prevotellaceae bacterium]
MIKTVILILVLNVPILSYALTSPVPAVVEQFYGSMKRMSEVYNESYAFDFRERIKDCFRGREKSGIPIPNDFLYWGYAGEKETPSNTYANRFYELACQKKIIRLEKYSITSNIPVSEVDLKKYRNQSSGLTQTVVKKIFTDGKTRKTFSDTLLIEHNEIVQLKNSISHEDGEDIDVLRAIAASYYTSKRYYSAYKIYEKIISIDPDNANAYYRLGLLNYF